MWTDLFKSGKRQASKSGVERVDCVDEPRRRVSAPSPGGMVVAHGMVAKSVDCVDSPKDDITASSRYITGSMPPTALSNGLPSCPDMPTVTIRTASTPSTQSTPGKHCKLLTAQEKKSLLARFELVLVRDEMRAPVAGCYTAGELRRTVNVAWWLITVEGWSFEAAVTSAGKWVVMHPAHPDEQHFVDVLAL